MPFFNISKISKYLLINLQAPPFRFTKALFAEIAFFRTWGGLDLLVTEEF